MGSAHCDDGYIIMSGPDDGSRISSRRRQLGQYPAAIIGMLTGFAVDLRAHAQTLDALLERLKQVDVRARCPCCT